MDLGISGKTALVLGASGGLGRAMAVGLAREGVNVAVAARGEKGLGETCGMINSAGAQALPLVWDLGDLSLIEDRVARVERDLGPVDILINNTGGPPPTTAAGQDSAVWLAQFQTMVASLIAITDRVLPGMRERRWGRIITSTSAGVVTPIPNLAISNTLRAALVGWSKTLSREVAKDGITANIIVPGLIATDRIRFLNEKAAERSGKPIEEIAKASLATIPMGRLGEPDEYAAMATFLASSQAAYVTGSVIRVDGGAIPSS